MTPAFDITTAPSRVLFGTGTLDAVADEVARLGRHRVLVLASPDLSAVGDRVVEALGPVAVARFDGAVMHTPVDVTDDAEKLVHSSSVDCVVSVGGGSTTGLSKALAARTGVDQVILPTTFAGSEVTSVLGETSGGVKTTRAAPEILPEVVIYDVDLVSTLPAAIAVTSAVNALAHAVEALYSPQANPAIDGLAIRAIRFLGRGLRRIGDGEDGAETRSELLQGAWLAGTCLGAVGMSLHHKLCHTLGGSFDLPHAPTHTVVLPHVLAYNAASAPEAMGEIARALDVADAASGVFDLIAAAGGPTALRDLGLREEDLSRAAQLAVARPYPNPAPLSAAGIEELLGAAWRGDRPRALAVSPIERITEQVVRSFAGTPNYRLRELLTEAVEWLHEFAVETDLAQSEWAAGIDFLTRTGQISDDRRQEFILLSDTLGLSSVVDLLTNSRMPDSTPSAVLGPFYVEGPPILEQGDDISAGQPGVPLWVDVRVTGTDGAPLGDAVVDVWQSDENGFYDVQLPDLDGPVLRGRLRTDDEGRLRFWSILPCEYPIPDDGPVGAMLAATGRHPYRAPHLHFMIAAAGHSTLITQLFVKGGSYLDSDAVFGVKDELIVEFPPGVGEAPPGRKVEGEWRSLDFTFKLAASANQVDSHV
ncbi:maleylacetate reductase and hydroxyquinol 1,2-dioxygenase domain-containing protein [Pseudonocardia alni]|uniref:maleylacetate reductase and hydroxyquinol 1,2-dioxygenase domain-containing protein n=1 Tax=Pseudonocardia alni TaxID=33907 RepID=UPI00280B8946|nr:maleylacetate reductase and hydroxyquinol 1,2-dioxygenase domain-containing protein [Pseudonocardia alni]